MHHVRHLNDLYYSWTLGMDLKGLISVKVTFDLQRLHLLKRDDLLSVSFALAFLSISMA